MTEKIKLLGKWKNTLSESNLTEQFKYSKYPANPVLLYNSINYQTVEEEFIQESLEDLREAAECHRQVRRYIQSYIKPGCSILDVCEKLESKTVELFGCNNLTAGIGFPTGCSINNIAAHDSAISNDTRTIGINDVVKIDFGTHVNGRIIDSAFTVSFNEKYNNLLQASKDGVWTAIKLAGPDARISEISSAVEEVVTSYEIELNNKIIPIKPIKNLGGHNIEPYKIHAGKLVLGSKYTPSTAELNRMNVGEQFAIEIFTTTGTGIAQPDTTLPITHYMQKSQGFSNLKLKSSKLLKNFIDKTYKTLPFCSRWLDKAFKNNYKIGLKELVNKNIITEYPPLVDIEGSYTAQWEHTILLKESGKEILSKGDDY